MTFSKFVVQRFTEYYTPCFWYTIVLHYNRPTSKNPSSLGRILNRDSFGRGNAKKREKKKTTKQLLQIRDVNIATSLDQHLLVGGQPPSITHNPTIIASTSDSKMTDYAEHTTRLIRATHTKTTVRVYQAYNDRIADAALEAQSFEVARQRGLWSCKRMTWIKPSKVWMAYRCGWTTFKDSNQSRVLALDLDRTKFEKLLAIGTLAKHHPNSDTNNNKKCRDSSVVVQWDPERVMDPTKGPDQVFTKSTPDVRSIQIGLRPPANECLLDAQVVKGITDVTQDFRHAVQALVVGRVEDAAALLWPDENQQETLLDIPSRIQEHLNMTASPTPLVKRENAVVVLGSTANPPHQGHLHCIRKAKSKAVELGFNVLFTTIAVAPAGYVKHKMVDKISRNQQHPLMLDDATRLKVLELTAANMEQEASFGFQAPTRTYGSAWECGCALRPNEETFVIVVVGGDRFKMERTVRPDMVTLCCARSEEQYSALQTEIQKDVEQGFVRNPSKWVLLSSVGPATSSTMIRSILVDGNTTSDQKRQHLLRHGYPDEAATLLLEGLVG
eukprot:scaffold34609_cov146-Amphora_coffeaeformis.AAC.11